MEIRARWQSGGRSREMRLEELAWDIPRRRPMERTSWIFTGLSPEGRGASAGSLVATYRDPDAVLNHPLPTGTDDTIYKANERLVPPVGTPVTVTLAPLPAGAPAKAESRSRPEPSREGATPEPERREPSGERSEP
jgi:hypothetical protein